jgi:hypothetical protein
MKALFLAKGYSTPRSVIFSLPAETLLPANDLGQLTAGARVWKLGSVSSFKFRSNDHSEANDSIDHDWVEVAWLA